MNHMAPSTVEIMNRGMKCLMDQLGVIDAKRFVATVIRENLTIPVGSGIIFPERPQRKSAKRRKCLK